MLTRFISDRRPHAPKTELTMRRLVQRRASYVWMTTGLALVAGLAITLTTQSQARARAVTAPGVKPTVVLVNGAWANNASWSGVIERLQTEGYTVDAPPNPLQSLNGDAGTIADFLKTINGPIVLVGHSYGGAVITNAATGNRNVKALVYVDAFAPAKGESVIGLDLSKEAAVAAATQSPVAYSAVTAPSRNPAWKTIPSWYVLGTIDKAIPPAIQLFMAQRIHAHITRVRAGHLSMMAAPGVVAKVITAAAKATS
jgi:pimeloyl-ACP methyl ester carboxylesterase